MANPIEVRPKDGRSRFAALSMSDRSKIIAEGRTVSSVMKRADKSGEALFNGFYPTKELHVCALSES